MRRSTLKGRWRLCQHWGLLEDEGAVEALVNGAVDEAALDGLVQMKREREGANLVRDLGLKFEEIRAKPLRD